MRNWFYCGLIFIYVSLDQITKYWCQQHIAYQQRWVVIPRWLDLTLVYNKGVAFSLFADQPSYTHFLIAILALAICSYMIYHIFHAKFNAVQKIAAGLIVGGAAGNLIDRFHYGQVIDFILFYHQSFSWPVFNLADSLITVGAFLLIIEGTLSQKRTH